MNNYRVTVNGKSFLVLYCEGAIDALEKLHNEFGHRELDIHLEIVDGDVIPMNTTTIGQPTNPATPSQVEPTAPTEREVPSFPASDSEKETEHLPVSNSSGRPVTTEQIAPVNPNPRPYPEPYPVNPKLDIRQAPSPEPVGYFNAPPIQPPPRIQSQAEERLELVRMAFLRKLGNTNAKLPEVTEDVRNWWYNAICGSMTFVDSFRFQNPETCLKIEPFSEIGVYASITGKIPLDITPPIDTHLDVSFHPGYIRLEWFIKDRTFLLVDINPANMTYEEIRYEQEITSNQVDVRFIDHVLAPLGLDNVFAKV